MQQIPLLHIKNLSISFLLQNNEIAQVTNNINITINREEIVAIVGESGSGKSVTALAILQLLPHKKTIYGNGEILWNTNNSTIDLLKLNNKQIQKYRGKKIAMIFQEPMTSLNPVITCGTQVSEVLKWHENLNELEAKKNVIELFKKVKLPNPEKIYNKYPHELSGGQKQRVMIAMAISCKPELLICDEPTTALDVTVQKSILQLIKELQMENKMGVIFITHDLGVVSEIADKIVVLYKGNVVETNSALQVLKNPQHNYSKALLACRPSLYSKGERLPVVSDFLGMQEKMVENNDTNIAPNHLTNKELIDVKNLSVFYTTKRNFFNSTTNQFKAVNQVSFSIYKGETLGLVGESGCGKTTLGRAILKLIKPNEGEVVYYNIDKSLSNKQQEIEFRRKMQLIFQDPYSALNPSMAIGDALVEPLIFHKIIPNFSEAKEHAITLLNKVGLKATDYNKYPHEFSGGQRQRIVIARALAMKPEFIVCDESVSALDVSVQAQILNLLNDLKTEFNFTALFISHDLAVVKYVSDRVIVMKNGSIEEVNNAEQFFNAPQSNYTKQLIEAMPVIR